MRLLILGHYEIASNYAISLLVEKLLSTKFECNIQIALSGKGDKKLEKDSVEKTGENEFQQLAAYERHLCDELEINHQSSRLNLKINSFSRLEKLAQNKVELLSNPNSAEGLRLIKQWNPDLIISIRYRKIFRDQAIAIPRLGIINLHSGLLPEYRGAMATFWSMLNKEEVYGSTLHYISDKSIDTGAIIARKVQKLNYSQTYLDNVINLYSSGVDNIMSALIKLQNNSHLDVQMPENKGNYYSFPEIMDLVQFKKMNLKLY